MLGLAKSSQLSAAGLWIFCNSLLPSKQAAASVAVHAQSLTQRAAFASFPQKYKSRPPVCGISDSPYQSSLIAQSNLQQGQYRTFMTMEASRPLPSLSSSIFSAKLYRDILSLWFEGIPEATPAPAFEHTQRWFGVGDAVTKKAFDDSCRDISLKALEVIGPAAFPLPDFVDHETDRNEAERLSKPLRDTLASAQTSGMDLVDASLALVLLLDQMPRNCFRDAEDQKMIYNHYDRLSRSLIYYSMDGAHQNDPLHNIDMAQRIYLNPGRRFWFFMPLEHSEDVVDHIVFEDRVTETKTVAAASDKQDIVDYVDRSLSFEARHRVILERFGRYPHRNGCLGRVSTAEEKTYLEDGGETFGTDSTKV